jgi:hypothetical protein
MFEFFECFFEDGVIIEECLFKVLNRCQVKSIDVARSCVDWLKVIPFTNVLSNEPIVYRYRKGMMHNSQTY